VDGTDLQELRRMMEIDIVQNEQAHEAEARVWNRRAATPRPSGLSAR